MNEKMAQHVSWLTDTAAVAQSTGIQAQAAAAAYEEAFAATVLPISVIANRAELPVLVATNILGQNTAAIMANEAEYSEMWAQDAAAMNTYSATSKQATTLTQFTSTPAATGTPAAATTTTTGGIVQQLLSQISLDPINDLTNVGLLSGEFIAAFIQGVPAMMAVSAGGNGFNPAVAVPRSPSIHFDPMLNTPEGAVPVVPKAMGGTGGMGSSGRIGSLSVPPAWANAPSGTQAPGAGRFVPFGGGKPAVPMGVMPLMGGAGRQSQEERRRQPRYGQKVQVLPKL
jgi:PPE-repeat protein